MRTVLISMVKNEADIIESFVRYHWQFVDYILIAENGSTDGTKEILNALRTEGAPLEILDKRSVAYHQEQLMTELLYLAVEQHQADMVLPLDADEFLIAADQGSVKEYLEYVIGIDVLLTVRWRTYVPHTLEVENDRFLLERFRFCRDEAYDVGGKIILTRPFIEKHHPKMAMGNHNVVTSAEYESFAYRSLKIAHFPIRSIGQACSKCFVGWFSSEAKGKKEKYESGHWNAIFDILKSNQVLTLSELQNLCAFYGTWQGEKNRPLLGNLIEQPVPVDKKIVLHYTKQSDVNYMENVLEHALGLARRYAQLSLEQERYKEELHKVYQNILLQILEQGGGCQVCFLGNKDVEFYIEEIRLLKISEVKKIRLCNLLAVHFYQHKRFEDVLPFLQQALSFRGDQEETLRNLGSFLYAVGEKKLAAVYFSKMREKDEEILHYLSQCE